MSTYPKLNVKKMIKPILKNYDKHVQRFWKILESINCEIFYDGPDDIHDCIRDKMVYSCSIKVFNDKNTQCSSTNKFKVLKNIFPVMIGSILDRIIRKKKLKHFKFEDLRTINNNNNNDDDNDSFEPMDIAQTFFIINGCVRQLPFFYTNDSRNMHVVRRKIVRCYTYDSEDKGKELSLYIHDDKEGLYQRKNHNSGDLVVVLNDGNETDQIQGFFDHCPYFINQRVYMSKVFLNRNFDIDNLGNKIIISPGHLFVKLFTKYLYKPLKDRNFAVVKSKAAMVVKSIESGSLLHVLSRKTVYFKESKSGAKMVTQQQENHRELGMNGEIYIEKDIGCYREISMQTYPLNPYLSHLIIRQISSKVKKGIVPAFNDSYLGFFCIVGDMETKNIGRTNMMVRNTFVSTHEDVSLVYNSLNLEVVDNNKYLRQQDFFVVVNEACTPITEKCFYDIDLFKLKRQLKYIECYKEENFILIRYKMGLMYRKISINDDSIWVTARDQHYWSDNNNLTFENLTSYLVDLNPFFNHNVFTKDILAFNILKNAVLATSSIYCEYFMETLSAYTKRTRYHKIVCEPVDEFSSKFVLRMPLVKIAYMSFKGINQEDCIVVRDGINAFDGFRFHTVRLKFDPPNKYVTFHPKRGDTFPDDCYVGHIVCHDENNDKKKFNVIPLTTHAKLIPSTSQEDRKVFKLYFSKPNFKIVKYDLTKDRLSICLRQDRFLETGDKLCSIHGQKGVVRKEKFLPMFGEEKISPDIIVNPYCLFRMTCGQIKEGLHWGGKDVKLIYNSDGKLMQTLNDEGIFFSKVFYFLVAYWAMEHFYAPKEVNMDLVFGQPVKGRSRNGGMRMGNMEINNGLRGNGIANCFEEKILEHGDRLFYSSPEDGDDKNAVKITPLPKSTLLCIDDAKFFKCFINFNVQHCLEDTTGKTENEEKKNEMSI